jgi:XRE family transcriptional regulator, regulator of sulfur utilization
MIVRRDLLVAALAASVTLACTTLADSASQPLDSRVWSWSELAAQKTPVGERREVVRQPTRTLDELEMHITTLNPHVASHAPHTHPNEEMIILKEGTVKAHVNGQEIVVQAGGVLFFASMQPHAVQNIGDVPATYYVVNWSTPAGRKQIPKTPPRATAQ